MEGIVTWTYTPYAGVLITTAIISLVVGFMALHRRGTPGAVALAILMFTITEWALASGLEAAVIGTQNKVLWSKIEYVGGLSAANLFLIFVLVYVKKTKWLRPIYLAILFIVPVIGFLITITNENLIWTRFVPSLSVPNTIIYEHGVVF